jgi:signal transduction histidine kinase
MAGGRHPLAGLYEPGVAVQSHAELQVLYEFSQQIGYTLDYDELVRRMLAHLSRIVAHDVAGSILRTGSRCTCYVRPLRALSAQVQAEIPQRLFESFLRMSAHATYLKPERLHRRTLAAEEFDALQPPMAGLGSAVQVPLIVGEEHEVVGLLFVGAEAETAFTEDQVRLLYTVATQTALSIQQLRTLLADTQQRLASLMEHLPEGVLMMDADLRLVLANPAAKSYLADLTDATLGEILTHLGGYPMATLLASTPEGLYHEIEVGGPAGLVFEVAVRPFHMGLAARGWVLLIRDSTERKRFEQSLAQYADELARSNAELEQFAYVASHDLQEPLRVVTGYVQLLQKRYRKQLDEDADIFIDNAVDGAHRMQQLIQDLLAYSRVGSQGGALEPTRCSAVLERTLKTLRVALEESHAVVTHDALPMVMADAAQLERVLQNLLRNAITFCSESPPVIHIGAERQGTMWVLSVRDNGIGIAPEFVDRIFLIFQRLHAQHTYPGTGMGLSICKKIIERHGGRIWVVSQPGKGATFFFTLAACDV